MHRGCCQHLSGEENKTPHGENIWGGSKSPSRGDILSCTLNTGLEKEFSRLQGALEEIQVSIPCKALLTLDLPIKGLGGGS